MFIQFQDLAFCNGQLRSTAIVDVVAVWNNCIQPIVAASQFNDDEYFNAQGYTGRGTPGLVNINTAPLEVLRTMPHMYKFIHEVYAPASNLRTALPEAMIQYRERFNGLPSTQADRTGITSLLAAL